MVHDVAPNMVASRSVSKTAEIYQDKGRLVQRRIKFVTASRRRNQTNFPEAAFSNAISKHLFLRLSSRTKNNNHETLSARYFTNDTEFDESDDENESAELNKDSLFPRQEIESLLEWRSILPPGPGIMNVGNTCFVNSILQSLLYTPPLAQMAMKGKLKGIETASNFFIKALTTFINEAFRESSRRGRSSLNASWFIANLKRLSSNLNPGHQHDAHEFLRSLLDAMHQECLEHFKIAENDPNQKAQIYTTYVYQIFGGILESTIKCGNPSCQTISQVQERFLDLSFEIQGIRRLDEAIRKFVMVEELDSENKWFCPSCEHMVRAMKWFRIESLPNILVVHLKRFGYGVVSTKLRSHVKISPILIIPKTAFASKQVCRTYSLYAVVVHSGRSSNSGHYISYIKASNGIWYEMDDIHVKAVSVNLVISQNAYILFYVKQSGYKHPLPRPLVAANYYTCKFWCHTPCRTRRIMLETYTRILMSKANRRPRVHSEGLAPLADSVQTGNETNADELVHVVPKTHKNIIPGKWQQLIAKTSYNREKTLRTSPKAKEVRYDEWDEVLDHGKTKRTKRRKDEINKSGNNPFQALADSKRIIAS